MAIMGAFSSHVRSTAGFALANFFLTLARLEIEMEQAFGFLASLPRGLHQQNFSLLGKVASRPAKEPDTSSEGAKHTLRLFGLVVTSGI